MREHPMLQELHRLEGHIIGRLVCVEEKLDKVRTEDLPELRVQVAADIAALKVKAGVWGLAAGVLGSLGALLLSQVVGK